MTSPGPSSCPCGCRPNDSSRHTWPCPRRPRPRRLPLRRHPPRRAPSTRSRPGHSVQRQTSRRQTLQVPYQHASRSRGSFGTPVPRTHRKQALHAPRPRENLATTHLHAGQGHEPAGAVQGRERRQWVQALRLDRGELVASSWTERTPPSGPSSW